VIRLAVGMGQRSNCSTVVSTVVGEVQILMLFGTNIFPGENAIFHGGFLMSKFTEHIRIEFEKFWKFGIARSES